MAFDKAKYNRQWRKENQDHIDLYVRKGLKAEVQEAAKTKGISITKWIESVIEQKLLEEQFD